MGLLKSQNSINITLPAEGTLLKFLVLGNKVCFHSMLSRLLVGSELCKRFITCDNLLKESLSFFTILLQLLQACFHACLFVLICKQLWHPPCTNFVIPKVLVDDGTGKSTDDIQLAATPLMVICLPS
jgi:hypothetical protein